LLPRWKKLPAGAVIPVGEAVAADAEISIRCGPTEPDIRGSLFSTEAPTPEFHRRMSQENESSDDFQHLSEISLRCAKNCRQLQEMARHSEPPPGLDALLAEMRRDVMNGLPLAEKLSDQLAAASPEPFQAGDVTASSRTLGNILLAQAMLQTVDEADGRGRIK
jgi:hypothetical protein